MARARCPCGREYNVSDSQLGQRLRCSVCGATFVAAAIESEVADVIHAELSHATEDELANAFFEDDEKPAERAPRRPDAPKTPRLGELAVERALVSQEHIDLCVKVQEALREQGVTDKCIGEILVEKGLLKPQQVEMLLGEQVGEVREQAPPSPAVIPHPPPPAPVERPEPERPRPEPAEGVVGLYVRRVALAAAVALLVVLAITFWPGPKVQRTLATYLESCREGAIQPKTHLAITNPGFVIRDFRIDEVLEPTAHDFSSEIKVFNSRHDKGTWKSLLEAVEMPVGKRQTLELILPGIPEALAPGNAESLTVTLQPVACHLFLKARNARFFKEGQYRVTMARIRSPRWDSGWRFAAYAPAESPAPK